MSKHLLNINEITNEALRALEDQLKFGDSFFGAAPVKGEGALISYDESPQAWGVAALHDISYEDPDAQEVTDDESPGDAETWILKDMEQASRAEGLKLAIMEQWRQDELERKTKEHKP
jgi:hypothetical protein